jgi:hypothetical protein
VLAFHLEEDRDDDDRNHPRGQAEQQPPVDARKSGDSDDDEREADAQHLLPEVADDARHASGRDSEHARDVGEAGTEDVLLESGQAAGIAEHQGWFAGGQQGQHENRSERTRGGDAQAGGDSSPTQKAALGKDEQRQRHPRRRPRRGGPARPGRSAPRRS